MTSIQGVHSVKIGKPGENGAAKEIAGFTAGNQEKTVDVQMKPTKAELDRLDWRILEALQANARLTNTEIGKRVGLSQPAVTMRIRRLEDLGVIEGYSARINLALAGREISAFIRLKTSHAHVAKCLKAFASMPEVIDTHRITGDDCFIVRVVVQQMAQLEAVIDALAKFGPVTTSIVLANYPQKGIGAPKA